MLIDPPKNGIHENVPADVYHTWNAVSVSWLNQLADSPATLRDYLAHPESRVTTEAKQEGSAVHCAVLEPDQFANRYVEAGFCVAELKSGARKGMPCGKSGAVYLDGKWFCGTHDPEEKGAQHTTTLTVLDEISYRWCKAIAQRVKANPRMQRYLAEAKKEVSIVGEIGGVVCKARVDLWLPGELCDLKTTIKGQKDFQNEIFRRNYHAQAWWYMALAQSVGNPVEKFTLVAAHKRRPFLVSYHQIGLTSEAARIGFEYCCAYLEVYKRCMKSGEWPGYSDEIEPVEPPTWAQKQIEEVEEEPFYA